MAIPPNLSFAVYCFFYFIFCPFAIVSGLRLREAGMSIQDTKERSFQTSH